MNGKVILFNHIRKTAGTTFGFILANSFGTSYCRTMAARPVTIGPDNLDTVKKFFPHLKAMGGHNVLLEGDFLSEHYFRVTFVREPISRMISHFQHYCMEIKDTEYALSKFHDWLNDPENQNHQTKMIAMTDNYDSAIETLNNTYDFIGLTEEFDVSLQILQQICPLQLNLNYKAKQKSKNKALADRIRNSDDHMQLIRKANETDIRLYDYIRKHYYEQYYYKKYSFDRDLKFNTIQSKYTPNTLKSKWYNKYIFRSYFRLKKWV